MTKAVLEVNISLGISLLNVGMYSNREHGRASPGAEFGMFRTCVPVLFVNWAL